MLAEELKPPKKARNPPQDWVERERERGERVNILEKQGNHKSKPNITFTKTKKDTSIK